MHMEEELEYLNIIRKSILYMEDFPAILGFSDDRPISGRLAPIIWAKHIHELLEIRMLFKVCPNGNVDYSQIADIHLTPAGVIHHGLDSSELYRLITIQIGMDEIRYMRGNQQIICFSAQQAKRVPGADYSDLASSLTLCSSIYAEDSEHVRLLIALLFSTLRRLLAAGTDTDSSPAEIIAAYIRANYYRNDLSIREIAHRTHFSPNYIQKVFRAKWHCTPIAYLNEVRMNAARQLLRQHRWQVKEVATMCGWNYVHYFCRRYREYFGNLPGDE